MKTVFYIFVALMFGSFVLVEKPIPSNIPNKFQEGKIEVYINEANLNKKIIEIENGLHETNALVQEQFDKK